MGKVSKYKKAKKTFLDPGFTLGGKGKADYNDAAKSGKQKQSRSQRQFAAMLALGQDGGKSSKKRDREDAEDVVGGSNDADSKKDENSKGENGNNSDEEKDGSAGKDAGAGKKQGQQQQQQQLRKRGANARAKAKKYFDEKKAKKLKKKRGRKAGDDSDDDDDTNGGRGSSSASRGSSSAGESAAARWKRQAAETFRFGDQADAPPRLDMVPKGSKKKRQRGGRFEALAQGAGTGGEGGEGGDGGDGDAALKARQLEVLRQRVQLAYRTQRDAKRLKAAELRDQQRGGRRR